jgi:glyoxylase-like metal-dependent hydrolase (beta-lactamase superfamily II)
MPIQIQTIPVGPLQTNCYLFACSDTGQAVMIDPGWSGEALFDLVTEKELDLVAILLTHAHFDHIAGAGALRELSQVPILAHPDSEPYMKNAHRHAGLWGIPMEPAPEPDGELSEKQIIEVGQLRLHVLHTPGHAPGHVCFHEPESRSLFDGDVLFKEGIGRTDFPGGDYATLMRSIREKLLVLPDDTAVYSGHGPATTIGSERRWNPFLR